MNVSIRIAQWGYRGTKIYHFQTVSNKIIILSHFKVLAHKGAFQNDVNLNTAVLLRRYAYSTRDSTISTSFFQHQLICILVLNDCGRFSQKLKTVNFKKLFLVCNYTAHLQNQQFQIWNLHLYRKENWLKIGETSKTVGAIPKSQKVIAKRLLAARNLETKERQPSSLNA